MQPNSDSESGYDDDSSLGDEYGEAQRAEQLYGEQAQRTQRAQQHHDDTLARVA